ncbi:MAG: hypothetical protein ACKVLL_05635, partial [Verrucomicrobiales bacterium]
MKFFTKKTCLNPSLWLNPSVAPAERKTNMASISRFLLLLALLFATAVPAAAAGGHQLPLYPESPFEGTAFSWISNSMIMVWLAAAIIILFCRAATKKLSLVPTGVQN